MLVSHADDNAGTRRDFLYYATAGAGVVATGAAVWPLVNQMNPSADVQALSSIFVDVSGVAVGTQLTVNFLGKPVFIRRRTPEEIEAARAVALGDLPDTASQNPNKPNTDAEDVNRSLDDAGEWLVMTGVCTHLGCVPLGNGSGDFGGWFCSAPATARITIRRVASAAARRRRTCISPSSASWTRTPSSSAKGDRHVRHSPRPLRAQDRHREMASPSPADRRARL